ncbi:DUF4326 domain-containing protein [Streptomyces antimycoticus]|uniref:DUF4326 domain-containing protein n=1 Tax=Streptomyces antimycoticus TaxID=68175 RepID=UPI001F263F76|nr:DUF4326 domain-containing protein [Streptomyces antimycoticus]
MTIGQQLDLFGQPEPATMAGPARPPLRTPPTAPGQLLEPMSDEAVAWIAERVIADYHTANERTFGDPDQNWSPRCRCQLPCTLCRQGQHSQCRELREAQWAAAHGPHAPAPETHLRVPAPYRPQSTRPLYVAVWLTDRACRGLCDCPECSGQVLTHHPLATVVCLKGRQNDPGIADVLYVGRPMYQGGWRLHGHLLANPYRIGKDGDAAQVVEKYQRWLAARPKLLARELPKLRGRRLGCWCPEGQPCHARVLARLANGWRAAA